MFTDHVALPFKVGFSRVQKIFTAHGLHQRIVFIGSGKLGFPEAAVFAFALGCDVINVGREAMMAIGCIQAQRCHTNHCPTGVATQHPWLVRGVDPTQQGGPAGQLHHDAAQGRAGAEPCVRCPASGTHHRGSTGAARRPVRFEDHCGALWIRPRLRTAVADGLRGSASPDDRLTGHAAVSSVSSGGRLDLPPEVAVAPEGGGSIIRGTCNLSDCRRTPCNPSGLLASVVRLR